MTDRWQDAAACHPAISIVTPAHWDADLLPDETRDERQARHDMARHICGRCPVAQQCLDEALADPERDGIYAGYLLEVERNLP